LGIVTAIQVFEAVRVLTGQEPKLLNKLLYIDLREMVFETLSLAAEKNCPACGLGPEASKEPPALKLVEETCARDGQRNVIISPKERININLDQLSGVLSQRGFRMKTSGSLGITFEQADNITTSILKSGTMIVQISPRIKDDFKDDALNTFRSILVEGLGLSSAILPSV